MRTDWHWFCLQCSELQDLELKAQAQQENYRRARGAFAANRVMALDRLIALAAQKLA